MTEGRIINLQS